MERLPDPLRAVSCLREIEGLSTEQTADALGLTIENVRVRLHRAKRSLQHALDERIGREVRRLYLFDGPHCDRMVENVFARLHAGELQRADARTRRILVRPCRRGRRIGFRGHGGSGGCERRSV